MGYFDRKFELAKKAKAHTAYVAKNFQFEINEAIKSTYLIDDNNCDPIQTIGENWDMIIEVQNADTVTAARNCAITPFITKNGMPFGGNGITTVLNFASYKNPGGMFIDGSSAQEEALCHESVLYNVLAAFDQTYYDWNRKNLNRGMYLNRALVSPNVLFLKETNQVKAPEMFFATIITCAAPNFGTGKRYKNVTPEENSAALDSRIKFVLDVATTASTDFLILGAWGCGVFKQNPYEVAELFKKYLVGSHYPFKKVIFAIPAGNENYIAFKKVFNC